MTKEQAVLELSRLDPLNKVTVTVPVEEYVALLKYVEMAEAYFAPLRKGASGE